MTSSTSSYLFPDENNPKVAFYYTHIIKHYILVCHVSQSASWLEWQSSLSFNNDMNEVFKMLAIYCS